MQVPRYSSWPFSYEVCWSSKETRAERKTVFINNLREFITFGWSKFHQSSHATHREGLRPLRNYFVGLNKVWSETIVRASQHEVPTAKKYVPFNSYAYGQVLPPILTLS